MDPPQLIAADAQEEKHGNTLEEEAHQCANGWIHSMAHQMMAEHLDEGLLEVCVRRETGLQEWLHQGELVDGCIFAKHRFFMGE